MEQLQIPSSFFVPVSELAKQAAQSADASEGAERDCIAWLTHTHSCSAAVVPYVKRLFAEFDRSEAYSRAHALLYLHGACGEDGFNLSDAEYIGLYDHDIDDYHVLWDRGWAMYMLVPRALVPKVWRCGYGGSPKFYDRDGNVIFQSVYSVDGRPLTRDERRRKLESEGLI